MFFKLFNNRLYSITELSYFTFLLLRVYIVWREYIFIGNVKMRSHEIRGYMDHSTFANLKKLSLELLFLELAQESCMAFVQIVFSDELSHISLWNLSKALSSSSDEETISWVFIFLINCKDFLIMLPVNIYISMEYEFNVYRTLQLLLLEFLSAQVLQFLLLGCWIFSSSLFINVSQSSLIVSIVLFLLTFVFARDFFLVDILIEEQLKPLTDPEILGMLRPFLKHMDFNERHVYLYKTTRRELPNAFTMGHSFFNNQKIVIADNIIGRNPHLNQCCTRREVVSILMHELGHVFHHHISKTCFLELVVTISTCVLFVLLHRPSVYSAYGFPEQPPAIITLVVRMDILLVFNILSGFLFMLHLRHCEYEADLFSFTFTRIYLRQALIKISLIQPQDLQTHDPLYSLWNLAHPSLMERLEFLYN